MMKTDVDYQNSTYKQLVFRWKKDHKLSVRKASARLNIVTTTVRRGLAFLHKE
jgi:predicted ArsR family transcriptional regulator